MTPSTEQEQKQSILPAIAEAKPAQPAQQINSTRVRLQTKIRAKIQSSSSFSSSFVPDQVKEVEKNVNILADEMLQEIIEESARVQKRTVLAIALTVSVLLCVGGLLSLFQENGQPDAPVQEVKVGVRFTLASAYHADSKQKRIAYFTKFSPLVKSIKKRKKL